MCVCVAPQVRGAFFEMMCALCEFTPGLVQSEAARLCPAVLLSIDDTDPVVLPPVWEAVLHVVSTVPVSHYFRNDLLCVTAVDLNQRGLAVPTTRKTNLYPLNYMSFICVSYVFIFFSGLLDTCESQKGLFT